MRFVKTTIIQQVIYWTMSIFQTNYKLIAIDLSKQIELENSDLKQQISFIGRLENDRATMFSSLRNQKKQHLNFHKIL